MSKLIARNLKPIPLTIFKLFQAVIQARKAIHAAFQHIVDEKSNAEMEKSNATHKHFIDALTEAFDALDGRSQDPSNDATLRRGDKANNNEFAFQNKFSDPSLGQAREDEDGLSSTDETSQAQAGKPITNTGKGKKGKRGKRSKQKSTTGRIAEAPQADVPVQRYRIIEDKDDLVSEYVMAVYAE
jgi:hypothetical protein